MTFVELLHGKVFLCSPTTSVRKLTQALAAEQAPVLLVEEGRLCGVIRDYVGLIRGNSDFDSPFSVGRLLAAVVRASVAYQGAERLEQTLRSGKASWVELLDRSKNPVAWFPLDEDFFEWLKAGTVKPKRHPRFGGTSPTAQNA